VQLHHDAVRPQLEEALREPLHDGGLPHAGFAHQYGVVRPPLAEDVEQLFYFRLAAQGGVELPERRERGGIAAVGAEVGELARVEGPLRGGLRRRTGDRDGDRRKGGGRGGGRRRFRGRGRSRVRGHGRGRSGGRGRARGGRDRRAARYLERLREQLGGLGRSRAGELVEHAIFVAPALAQEHVCGAGHGERREQQVGGGGRLAGALRHVQRLGGDAGELGGVGGHRCHILAHGDRRAQALPLAAGGVPLRFSSRRHCGIPPCTLRALTIGIAGGTASGKTTVARRLVDRLAGHPIALLDQDAYY